MGDSGVVTMLMPVISVILFCLCCSRFLREMRTRIPLVNETPYSKAALRVSKAYKVGAWGSLVGVFLMGLVMSFIEVFTRL